MAESTADQTKKSVGIEISTGLIKCVCLSADGALSASDKRETDAARSTLEQLIAFIGELKNRFGDFDRIGIAVPGLVHQETKRIAFSTYFPEHSEVDLVSELEAATQLKITIENDANAAAFGEYSLGAGRGSRSMFYVTLGTGVGGALIIDGKIWRGAAGFAGEFGYLTLDSEGLKLEEVASAANIVRRTRSRFNQDGTSSLSNFDEREITIEDIIREARKDDDFARMMLERTGAYVGTAIAGVINLLNVEKIVVGGEIMAADSLVLGSIVRRAQELSFKPSFESSQIVEGSLGDYAAAIGAALLANEIESK